MRFHNDDILRVAAYTLGGRSRHFSETIRWILYDFGYISFPCHGMRMPIDEPVIIERANNKIVSRGLLGQSVPVVPWELVDTTNPSTVSEQGEWVLKPINGMKGIGVIPRLRPMELEKYYQRLSTYSRYVFLERYINNNQVLRIIILDGEAIGAYATEAPILSGNGHDTISELMYYSFESSPFSVISSIPTDMESEHALEYQGFRISDIPAVGVTFNPTYTINISRGAHWKKINSQETIHEEVLIAKKAASLVGLRLSGVDIITSKTGNHFILEVNPSPGIRGQTYDLEKRVVDLRTAQTILRTTAKHFGHDITCKPNAELLSLVDYQKVLSEIENG